MYKVTGYFRDNKISRSFTDVYDAIDFRDVVDAHYPIKVTFEKVIDMREFVYNSWNAVMDHEKNPLSAIPDFGTRHMIMQILAWMWCIVFGIIVGSMYAGVFSMVMHTLILGALAITVGTFETAKRKPQYFGGFGRGSGGEHE
jgi:tetrahydromethanopterin S-methyltransferase subunit B